MTKSLKLSLDFYIRDTTKVAKDLLGKKLVHVVNGRRLSGVIVETEAYLGVEDKACHTFGGRRTEKTKHMFLEGGHAYVYFIYGMYFCFNVVTQKEDVPEAVLVRALEPAEGIEAMLKNRSKFKREMKKSANHSGADLLKLCNGPGKLCQALGITKAQSGLSLGSDELFIEKGIDIPPSEVIKASRIGVDYAGEHAKKLLRFYVKGSPSISKPS